MLSSLLRPRQGRRRVDRSSFVSPFTSPAYQNQGDTEEDIDQQERGRGAYNRGEESDGEGGEDEDNEPLLPIFSAAHLGIYHPYHVEVVAVF